jgi:hypothetical protein
MENLVQEENIRRGLVLCPTRNLLVTELVWLSDRLQSLSARLMKMIPRDPEHLEGLKQEAGTIRERMVAAREELWRPNIRQTRMPTVGGGTDR